MTDAHLTAALDQLLDTRNQLTRVLLGGEPTATALSSATAVPSARPGGPVTA